MVVLTEVSVPSTGVRLAQPQVQVYFEQESVGDGELFVTERSVTWVNRQGKGFSLPYPSIILHAISTDLSTFPHECIFVLVDNCRAERRGQREIAFYTAAEAQHVNELQLANQELNGGEDDQIEDDDSDSAPNVSIRLVPTDTSVLNTIYNEMSACQELNPEEEDMQDLEEEDEEEDVMEQELNGGGDSDIGIPCPSGGRWFTAENLADVQLSEEGMANLQRMLGNQHDDSHEHNGGGDEAME